MRVCAATDLARRCKAEAGRKKITGQKLLVRDGKSRARLWAEDEKNEGGSVERNCDREENLARHVWEGQWNTYSGTGPASSPLGGSRGSPGAFGSTVWGDEAPEAQRREGEGKRSTEPLAPFAKSQWKGEGMPVR